MFDFKKVCFILLTALLFRIVLMLLVPYPFSPFPINTKWIGDDQPHYDLLGWNVAQGRGFSESLNPPFEPSITRPPGYPLFLSGVYYIFGHNHKSALIIQSILDSLVAVFIFLFSLSLFKNRAVAYLAGMLAALCPFTAFFSRILMTATLGAFLLTVSVILIMYAFRGSKRNRYLIAGLLMGFTILTKPIFFIYPLFLCIIKLKLDFNRKQILNLLIYAFAITLCILPWTVRNYYHFKKPIPSQAAIGVRLWLMSIDPCRLIQEKPGGLKPAEEKMFVKFLSLEGKERLEYDGRLKEIAIAWIKKAPFKYLCYSLRRIPKLWISSYSHYISIEEPLLSIKEKSKMFIKILLLLTNVFYLSTGLLGYVFLLKKWRSFYPLILLFVYITVTYAFFGGYEARYTIPAWPLLAIFSSFGIMTIYKFGKVRLKK